MSKESATAMLAAIPAPVTSTPAGEPGLIPAPVVKQETDSTRFAHLAKKEAALVKDREAFKAEQTAHMSEKEKMKAIHQKLQDFDAMKAKDPVAALKLAGFSETDLVNFLAAGEDTSTPEERATKAAQKEIQKFRDEESKKTSDAQNKRNTDTLTQFRSDINKTISSNPDKFELCNHNGPIAEDLIYETVAAILEDGGGIISTSEAAEMVEQYYEDQYKTMSGLKKFKPAPVVEAPTKPEMTRTVVESLKPEVNPRIANSMTLSQKTNATGASTITRKETSSEKRERLMAKLANMGK